MPEPLVNGRPDQTCRDAVQREIAFADRQINRFCNNQFGHDWIHRDGKV